MATDDTNKTRPADVVNQVYERLIGRFLSWAQQQEPVRAVIQVGSRTRRDHPADEWADVDLMLYATTPEVYMGCTDWLEAIASVWISIPSRTAGGDPEQLVMFEGGYNVDFVFCSMETLEWLRDNSHEDPLFQRGARVLLDKDGLAAHVIPKEFKVPMRQPPSKDDFRSVCDAFWYTAVYIARQIRRGELWLAKMIDVHLKATLLRMLEWHAGVTSQWQRDTWHNGRFIHKWADARTLEEVKRIFGAYEAEAASQALLVTTDLFRWLAQDTATDLGYEYPYQTEERVIKLIQEAIGCP